jgi:riboflavin kinase/FMN adenylyltransferase
MAVRVCRGLHEIGPEARPAAVTIGNFDGVHVAHHRIFTRLVEAGRQLHARPTVLTFDPHPTKVVAPERAPRLLSSTSDRIQWMAGCGIEQVVVLPFDRAFSQLSPREFVEKTLVDALGARLVLVGFNFHCGNKQSGNIDVLRALGEEFGFTVEVISGMSLRGRVVSSTEVRRLIDAGAVSSACRLLGRPYALGGDVVAGHGVGGRQTVPTLNLRTDAEVLPAVGVYITRTTDLDRNRSWKSITNVGYRPTFGGSDLSIETFLLDPLEGPRPDRISVAFLKRVRDERKFETPEALKGQILKDVGKALRYFARTARFSSQLHQPTA